MLAMACPALGSGAFALAAPLAEHPLLLNCACAKRKDGRGWSEGGGEIGFGIVCADEIMPGMLLTASVTLRPLPIPITHPSV